MYDPAVEISMIQASGRVQRYIASMHADDSDYESDWSVDPIVAISDLATVLMQSLQGTELVGSPSVKSRYSHYSMRTTDPKFTVEYTAGFSDDKSVYATAYSIQDALVGLCVQIYRRLHPRPEPEVRTFDRAINP